VPIILLLLAGVVLIGNLIFANFKAFIFSIIVVSMGVMYPIYFKNVTKRICLFKNIYVSLVFALMVCFPLIYYSTGYSNLAVLISLSFFVFFESLINQIALDSKDVMSDRKMKLLTLPALVGKEKSIRYLKVTSFVVEALLMLLLVYFRLDFVILLLIGVSVAINQVYLNMIKEGKKIGYILSASKFFLWFVLALVIFK
jgi:4-hydroxybenzoate polyprenyltransferase